MKFRFLLALWAGKLSVIALRILRYRGTVMPGRIALKICPDFLKYAQYPKKMIAITGTNAKTTVINMLNDLLTADGLRVLTNKAGANVDDGLSTMMVRGLTVMGKCNYDICIYEVDEHWAQTIFRWLPPELVLITNLSRDSIARNAHPGYIRDVLNSAIPKSVRLVLNADNPFSAFIAPDNPRSYFGVDLLSSDMPSYDNLIHDGVFCPNCGGRLIWDIMHFSDIGRMHCPHCGLRSPKRDYTGMNINTESGFFDLQDRSGSIRLALPDTALFNIYDAVSAAAVLREMGYKQEKIADLFSGLEITESRYHCTKVGDSAVFRILSKDQNAYANSRVFEYIRNLPGNKEIVYMCACTDCDKEWSENIAWIYDCDFELLNLPEMQNIVLYGSRALDYKLRLLLAGIPQERISITDTIEEMPDRLKLFPNDQIFILYGTDSYPISHKVEARVIERLKEKMKL